MERGEAGGEEVHGEELGGEEHGEGWDETEEWVEKDSGISLRNDEYIQMGLLLIEYFFQVVMI